MILGHLDLVKTDFFRQMCVGRRRPLAGQTALASELVGRMHEKSRIPPECSHSPLRRDRDSNPGNSYPFTAFRVRPDRPLRHLSKSVLAFRPQIYYLFHYINMENTFF